MTLSKLYATMMNATALSVAIAGSVSAADLEFYFPVGVNAPAVETIQALTDEWANRKSTTHSKSSLCGQLRRHYN